MYECRECKKSFYTKRLLRRHLPSHNRSNICDVCGKSYAWPGDLKIHLLSHEAEKEEGK